MKKLIALTVLSAASLCAFTAQAAPAETAETAATVEMAATAEGTGTGETGATEEEEAAEGRVVVGEDLVIEEGEIIDGDVVVTGGDLTVNGTVTGDAVCTAGDLTVGPTGVIKGDAVSVAGKMTVAPGAEIGGGRVCVACGVPGVKKLKLKFGEGGKEASALTDRIVKAAAEIVFFGFLMFVALLLTAFLPRQFDRVDEHLAGDFPRSVLVGVAALLLLPLIMLVLTVTIIGIPLVALVIVVVLISVLVGYVAFGRVLGRKLVGERHVMLQVFVGLLLLQGAALVGDIVALPGGVLNKAVGGIFVLVGWVIFIAGSFIGLGAVVYSYFGKRTLAETVAAREARRANRINKYAPPA